MWLWPHLLSLDAPLVAVAWSALLARSLQMSVQPAVLLILALTVWVIYAADRLLDVRTHLPATSRHLFARTHRFGFGVSIWAALSLAGGLSAQILHPDIFWRGVCVALGVALYMVAVHWGPLPRMGPRGKQFAVSVLFAAGVVLPFHTARGIGIAWAVSAAVVWLNIYAIEEWESGQSRPTAVVAVSSISIGGTCFLLGGVNEYYRALALAALLIFGLNWNRARLSSDLLRTAVDAVLFAPALAILLR